MKEKRSEREKAVEKTGEAQAEGLRKTEDIEDTSRKRDPTFRASDANCCRRAPLSQLVVAFGDSSLLFRRVPQRPDHVK